MHGRQAFDLEQPLGPDRAGTGHARQVITHQVDDHQILGPVLGAGLQFARQPGVAARVDVAGPCALDRPRFDTPGPGLKSQKQFGRVRYQRPVPQPPVGPVGRGPGTGEAQHHIEGFGSRRQVAPPGPGDIGLEQLPGGDPGDHIRHCRAIGRIGGFGLKRRGRGVRHGGQDCGGQPTRRLLNGRPGRPGVDAATDGPHPACLMIEPQHRRIAGQGQVRPHLSAGTGGGAGTGVIADQAHGSGGEFRPPQGGERGRRPDRADVNPVRIARDPRPAPQGATVREQGQGPDPVAQSGGDRQGIRPRQVPRIDDAQRGGHADRRAPIRSRSAASTPRASAR